MNNEIKHTHSIRKYNIGAASVVLGMIIFLGNIGSGDAQASESDKDIQKSSNPNTEMHTNLKNNNITQPALNTSAQTDKSTQHQPSSELKSPKTVDQATQSTHANIDKTTPKVNPQDHHQSTKPSKTPSPQTPKNNQVNPPKAKENVIDALKQTKPVKDIRNITSKVKVQSAEIKEVHQANTDKKNLKHINPHKGDKLKLKYQWKLGKDVKSGDYVDIHLSDNVNTKGVVDNRVLPNIKEGKHTVAVGKLVDNHKLRYTFTDYVNQRTNINVSLNLDLYINRQNVLNDSKQTVMATLGNLKTERQINVTYDQGASQHGVKVNGTFSHINPEKKTFEHITYVTSQTEKAKSGLVSAMLVHGQDLKGKTSVKVYEYIGKGLVNQSLTINPRNQSMFKDVTYLFDKMLFTNSHGYHLEATPLNRQYLIVFNGTFNENADSIKFDTQLLGFKNPLTEEKVAHVGWSNQIKVFKDNVTGSGTAISALKDSKMDEDKEKPKGEDKPQIQPKPEDNNKMKPQDQNKPPKDKNDVPKPKDEMKKPTPEKQPDHQIKPEQDKDHMMKKHPQPNVPKPMPMPKEEKQEQPKGPKMIQDRHQMTPPTTGEQPMMKNHKRTHEMSQKKAQQNDKHMKSMLPKTGQTTSTETTTLFGTLLAILGLTAFVTRRKENKN
ncbi:hypothetical protein BU586_04380 [Staphylococcus agnetis]|uniref:Ig-like domain-containing protein n=2 Tax=Staphylococcus agnetis TaxID=985762 RepID=UPI000D1BD15D|nr:Ig-like domain-containing protein [Staphylococcus agnetis]MCO4326408.1 Ig-like domain-containing protein [Staphylococcus agnetis]MCO4369175.1 Ig-like domain-containing protein [Staphylococcus agnetis]PTH31069.1 hypothetical protein BU589_10700 [Staphylococcus agnetis]PTH70473.1 hypothetical protein BU586_04380 [Staphylococcus agnetis]